MVALADSYRIQAHQFPDFRIRHIQFIPERQNRPFLFGKLPQDTVCPTVDRLFRFPFPFLFPEQFRGGKLFAPVRLAAVIFHGIMGNPVNPCADAAPFRIITR